LRCPELTNEQGWLKGTTAPAQIMWNTTT